MNRQQQLETLLMFLLISDFHGQVIRLCWRENEEVQRLLLTVRSPTVGSNRDQWLKVKVSIVSSTRTQLVVKRDRQQTKRGRLSQSARKITQHEKGRRSLVSLFPLFQQVHHSV